MRDRTGFLAGSTPLMAAAAMGHAQAFARRNSTKLDFYKNRNLKIVLLEGCL